MIRVRILSDSEVAELGACHHEALIKVWNANSYRLAVLEHQVGVSSAEGPTWVPVEVYS